MKMIVAFLVILLTSMSALAQTNTSSSPWPMHPRMPINKIVYTISAEQWVVSEKAKVTVNINANLQQQAVDQLQNQVMDNLKKLSSDAEWRIIEYSRNQDQSDLERVNMSAEARLPQSALNNIRQKAKDLSKPGVKYTIDRIEYSPSAVDVEKVRDQLRQQIYQRTQEELTHVNKIYANSNFSIHKIKFFYGDINPQQFMSKEMGSANIVARSFAMAPAPASMTVSQKEKMTVLVIFASKMG